jgi:N-acetylmuramoyl-L-alanine amidase
VLVALDAGHGGRDSGAISALGKAEKHYTLAQSLACGSFLIGAGMDVKFTRTDDTFVTLRERARLANEWGVDAFLSFHWNSSTSPVPSGTIMIRHERSERAGTLAELLLAGIKPLDGVDDERWDRIFVVPDPTYRNGIVPTVVGRTRMPAVILEVEFGSNPDAAALLDNVTGSSYIVAVAGAVRDALLAWGEEGT